MSKTGPTRDDARPAFTERQFREALSEFATGVTIITTRDSGTRYVGFTANSFNSVSLAPPLVLWSLSRAADSHLAFEQCERYAINVLAVDQVPLARRFSRPHADRFSGVPYTLGWANAPLIEGAAAWLECRHFSWQPIGDHTLFVGEVVHCTRNARSPLIFHHGRFETTAPLPPRSQGS
jgi:flavin reductase (DIM6/NTAB) family NADH-FMN oxidoreductase RutF